MYAPIPEKRINLRSYSLKKYWNWFRFSFFKKRINFRNRFDRNAFLNNIGWTNVKQFFTVMRIYFFILTTTRS